MRAATCIRFPPVVPPVLTTVSGMFAPSPRNRERYLPPSTVPSNPSMLPTTMASMLSGVAPECSSVRQAACWHSSMNENCCLRGEVASVMPTPRLLHVEPFHTPCTTRTVLSSATAPVTVSTECTTAVAWASASASRSSASASRTAPLAKPG